MPALSVMFKTVSSNCNLDCAYCYYRASRAGERPRRSIDRRMLEKFVPEYLDYISDTGAASFGWQGGEPTLAGLDFFEWVIDLEARHARDGTVLSNDIQTNGVLIDDAWAEFFRQYSFLVGVSLDGPQELHDTVRRGRSGRGSFSRVMNGLDALRRHETDLNILCVIGPHNVDAGGTLFDFFRLEGFTHVQLLPAMDFQATEPYATARYAVSAEEYGDFLVTTFDAWHGGGYPQISVRTFDSFLQSYLGGAADLCIHGERCDSGFIVEHDGEVYPCDFHIHADFSLGNITSHTLSSMARGRVRTEFLRKKQPLPRDCEACEWFARCNGGCPRNRIATGRDYLCESYRRLFAHADDHLRALADRIQRRAIYLEQLAILREKQARLPGRNDPCLCGSGRKTKVCCGNPALDRSYLFAHA